MKVTMLRQTAIAGEDVMIGKTVEVDEQLGQFLINKGKAELAVSKAKKKAKK